MGRFAEDRAEIRQVWREHRDNVNARAKIYTYYYSASGFRAEGNYKGVSSRQLDFFPNTGPAVTTMETPAILFLPRWEWFCSDYWKLRWEGFIKLLEEDARCPGRFQARLELAYERFRGRAISRNKYQLCLAEQILGKKYHVHHDTSDYLRNKLGVQSGF